MVYGNYFLKEIGLPNIIIPKYLYHGSPFNYKYLLASGLDFGNSLQKPGWSLYTWTKEESAYGWAIFGCIKEKLYKYFNYKRNGCLNSQTTVLSPDEYEEIINVLPNVPKEDKTFYVYKINTNNNTAFDSNKYEWGLGHSSNTPNCITLRTPDKISYEKKYTVVLTKELLDRYTVIRDDTPSDKEYGYNKRALSILMTNDFMIKDNGKLRKAINIAVRNGELQVGDDIVAFIKSKGLKLKSIGIERYFNESFHKSELDDNFKKKSNKDINYEVLDIHSSKAKKYIDNDSYLSKQNLKSYNGEIIVDKDNNTIIGRFLIGTGKDEGYIGALRVNDKYKGYGFGSMLVKDSVNKYHGRDLNVMKDNKVAIELYKKNGFKIIDHPINSSKDSYYMKLNKNR